MFGVQCLTENQSQGVSTNGFTAADMYSKMYDVPQLKKLYNYRESRLSEVLGDCKAAAGKEICYSDEFFQTEVVALFVVVEKLGSFSIDPRLAKMPGDSKG